MLGKIRQLLLEESYNWVLWLPVFFGLGIAVYFALPYEPTPGSAIRLVTAPVVLLVLGRRIFILRAIAIILLFIGLGFATIKIKADTIHTPFISTDGKSVTVSGNIEEISYANDYPRLTLTNLRIDDLGKNMPDKIRLTVRTKIRDEIKVGDRIITDAVIMTPPVPNAPGAYDFARQAYFKGIGGTGFATRQVIKLKKGREDNLLADTSTIIGERIYKVLPGNEGAIAAALINGDRARISDLVNQDFRNSGLYHLLSISGVHLVLVTGVFFFLARFLMSLSYRLTEVVSIKKIAAGVALVGGLLYLLISGLQVPAVRAFIMSSLILFAIMIDRTPTPMRSVALAFLVVLLFEPAALVSASFQMSFAAASALIATYQYITTHHPNFYKNKWLAWTVGSVLTSLIAGLSTAPYAAYHFGQWINYSLIANMLAAPITAFLIMPAAVAAVLLMPIGLEWLALKPMGWGITAIMEIAEYVAGMKGAYTMLPFIPTSAIIFFTIGFVWLVIWQTKWRLFGLVPIVIAIALPMFEPKPDIIISETGKLYALNNNGRLEFNKTRESFSTKMWLVFFGQKETYAITSYKIKGCDFYGMKLELTCNGKTRTLPKNSVIYLPDRIEKINPYEGRIWQ